EVPEEAVPMRGEARHRPVEARGRQLRRNLQAGVWRRAWLAESAAVFDGEAGASGVFLHPVPIKDVAVTVGVNDENHPPRDRHQLPCVVHRLAWIPTEGPSISQFVRAPIASL